MLSRAAVLSLSVTLLIATAVACGGGDDAANADPGGGSSGNPGQDGGPNGGGDGSTTNPGQDSGEPLPQAKGDPCAGGVPVPDDQHYHAPDVCVRLVATAVPGSIRQLMFAPNGDLFGQSGDGSIWLMRDEDGDGFFSKAEVHKWATTGGNGNNAHVDAAGGFVYAGSNGGVQRFAYDPNSFKGGAAQDVVVNQPTGGHSKHTTHVYDGFLYVHSGSSGNATHETGGPDYDTKRSLIKRFDLSKFNGTAFTWDQGEVVAVGIRNGNGFARNEITKKIYDVSHGLDNVTYNGVNLSQGAPLHDDNPGEQVMEIAPGKKYGYPFCWTAQRVSVSGNVKTPGTQLANEQYGSNPHDDAWCATNSEKPTTFLQAHSAPMDITFFDKQPIGALPEKWRGGAFITFHGAWNRETLKLTGFKVVWQPFNADGSAPNPTSTATDTTFPYETVFSAGTVAGGEVQAKNGWSWSDQASGMGDAKVRPVGVAVGPIDGALYFSSDEGSSNVYRVGLVKK
ncbi:MAG: hypothetical protein JST00_44095 [Deltaproteobacteria bacterium]|nr:hypothetical protein [Deltaproteobacteria bacterium]